MKVGEQVVGDLLFCFRLSGGDAVAFVVDHADGQQIGFYFSRCACGKLSSFRAIVISLLTLGHNRIVSGSCPYPFRGRWTPERLAASRGQAVARGELALRLVCIEAIRPVIQRTGAADDRHPKQSAQQQNPNQDFGYRS